MDIVQFVHEGLGNSSYLVGLQGDEALLVDPDRNVDRYVSAAADRGWRITHVLESHVHADFVSGNRELAWLMGAQLLLPAEGGYRFDHRSVAAGGRLRLGGIEIEALASPGHTPEHLSYVLRSPERHPPALFSGGSLIVGGAARTDLITPERTVELTRAQHRTLTSAFQHLPDETQLYPTHGGGSYCSTGSADRRTSTLGQERAENPLLQMPDEEEFADWFPSTFPAAPTYFFRMRPLNQAGPKLKRELGLPPALSPLAFDAAARGGAFVLDTRPVRAYGAAHVAGSLSIPFRPAFATWLGWVAPPDRPLLLVTDGTAVDRLVDECLLVGYERLAGHLDGGMGRWMAAGLPVSSSEVVDANGASRVLGEGAAAIDVREPSEFTAGHIPGAVNIPLGSLPERLREAPRNHPVLTYCGHGERAVTAASILEQAGLRQISVLEGGPDTWRQAGHQLA